MSTHFLVIENCQLSPELSGNLWYIRTLGVKNSNVHQEGLFLIRSPYTDDAQARDSHQEDLDTFEAWWQLSQEYLIPFDEKLQTFREKGVIWLDDSLLSIYFPPMVMQTSAACTLFKAMFPLTDFYLSNYKRVDGLTLAYQSYRRYPNQTVQLLLSYLETHAESGRLEQAYEEMRTCLVTIYQELFSAEIPELNPFMLVFGLEMLACPKGTWWLALTLAGLAQPSKEEPLDFDWTQYGIQDIILAYLLAFYWREHPDVDNDHVAATPLSTIQIPLPVRQQLWELYYTLHHDRLQDLLNLEDARTISPSEEEIKLALLREEQAKFRMPDLSPWQDVADIDLLTTRIQTYISQFYQFLGYQPDSSISAESKITNHQSQIPNQQSSSIEYLCYILVDKTDKVRTNDEIEQQLAKAAREGGHALAECLTKNSRYGYLDFQGDNVRGVYDTIKKHFPFIKFGYKTFARYFKLK